MTKEITIEEKVLLTVHELQRLEKKSDLWEIRRRLPNLTHKQVSDALRRLRVKESVLYNTDTENWASK